MSPDVLDGSSSDRHINFPDRGSSIEDLIANRRSRGPTLPRPAVPTERPRQLLDDKDWGLMTPNDIVKDYLSKQGYSMPDFTSDGRDRNKMSAMERFYDRQGQKSGAASPESSFNPGNLFDAGQSLWGGAVLPGALNGFGNPAGVRPDALSDVLGIRNNAMSPEAIRDRDVSRRQMEAFKRALEYQQPTAFVSPLATIPVQPQGTAPGVSRGTGFVMPRNPFDSVAGTYNQSLATAAPTAPTAPMAPMAPGQPNPYIQTYTTPVHTAPPRLDFNIPKRHF
ncbi:MAG TPA: hypothetical protein VK327_18715 [Candidatus Paceibacterota bacterium]|nr:hypothetical protein [Candidatus Paceibacterota bacterium]